MYILALFAGLLLSPQQHATKNWGFFATVFAAPSTIFVFDDFRGATVKNKLQ